MVSEPIQESKSAKKSGNRPLFLQMIKDIEKGKYDGILAWHPDRLSPNSIYENSRYASNGLFGSKIILEPRN